MESGGKTPIGVFGSRYHVKHLDIRWLKSIGFSEQENGVYEKTRNDGAKVIAQFEATKNWPDIPVIQNFLDFEMVTT